MNEEQLVVFRLGKEEYAVSISQVKGIIHNQGATKIPSAPEYMEGVINLRGKVIPVAELATRFGIEARYETDSRIIIVETAGQEVGIVVDEVTEVISLQQIAIEPAPAMAGSSDYVRGVGKENDRLLILLDLEKLFKRGEIETSQVVNIT